MAPSSRRHGRWGRRTATSGARSSSGKTALGEPLVSWAQGQPARLTPFAERLLWAETRARARLTPHIEALRVELERVLAEALDGSQQVLTVFASHDLALPLLRERAGTHHGLHIDLRFAGSMDALRGAGRRAAALVAGFHVPPLARQRPRVRAAAEAAAQARPAQADRLHAPHAGPDGGAGQPAAAARRCATWRATGVRFINRQGGSGTRLLTDHLLAAAAVPAASISGYAATAEDSHLAVAAAVASGVADAGMGIEAAARQFGLSFVPLVEEDYFLVCLREALDQPAVPKLREALRDAGWQRSVNALPGYAARRSAEVLSLTRALPWWHFRVPKVKTQAESTT